MMKEKNNEYVFRVARSAGKHVIKEAVEMAFKVKVDSVRTSIIPGKKVHRGRRVGRTPSWKKAIVKLKKDQTITAFENV